MGKCWVYHATEEPKIVDADKAQEYYDDGWKDSPRLFVKTTDFGIQPNDTMAVQALGETIEGVADRLNGELNVDEMKPKELKEYAMTHFGQEIAGNRAKLVTQVNGLINAESISSESIDPVPSSNQSH